ncbi:MULTISPECIES: hypothetical protein [unclassified Luteimonas]|uniref:hypothetical protein n=1 Tax=unclassified Luteimonas TaxID=2629088 RepID=UPI001602FE13|nr:MULTISPECIES: hypothetical protein [unclassified Luteimonas]MBB1472309.1 hypothetical protein [Luteimonas sp. MC1782]MBB6598974.1 hypothetical protein [Luteimonas sp. MC1825]QOC89112.1 hypothetical protein IDM46_05145 [Luteimonas sp. MC1825]
MRHTAPAALLLGAALATVGCRPAPDPDPVPVPQASRAAGAMRPGVAPTAAIPAAANVPGTDAVVVADHTSPAGAGTRFDARAFSGVFRAPGTQLAIEPDGRYALSSAGVESVGSWSLEPGSGLVLLDPDAKDEPDHRFALPSHDELAPQDGGVALRRGAATGKR